MSMTPRDHNLYFLGIVLRASDLNPLNNRNIFAPPTDLGPYPVNSISTSAQITEVVSFYKDDKEKFTTYCEFRFFSGSLTSVQENEFITF